MKVIAVPEGSVNITAGDEEEMKKVIYMKGPVSVCY